MITSKRVALLAWGVALALIACPGEKKGSNQNAEKPIEKPPVGDTMVPTSTRGGTIAPDDGKKLFLTGCASCHGPDGSGAMMRQMLPNIGDLTSPEMHKRMSDEDISTKISKGKDKMPPFESVFKPDQIKLIVQYVRTLKKG